MGAQNMPRAVIRMVSDARDLERDALRILSDEEARAGGFPIGHYARACRETADRVWVQALVEFLRWCR